jgi:hypothetical protein
VTRSGFPSSWAGLYLLSIEFGGGSVYLSSTLRKALAAELETSNKQPPFECCLFLGQST